MMNKKLIEQYLHPLSTLPTSLSPRGSLKQNIECILFDIYGTLFISSSGDINWGQQNPPPHEQIKQLLARYAIAESPRRILEKLHETIEARHGVLRNRGVDHPEVIIEHIWRQVLKINDLSTIKQFAVEFELITNPVGPMPHLASMLSACRKKNLLMGIISNAQFYTPFLFNWFLHSDIEALFEMAAEKLASIGIQPAAVLYIGNDMLNDIYPASAIGFQTALFAGDRRSLRLRGDDPRCADLRPELVLTDLGQLAQRLSVF